MRLGASVVLRAAAARSAVAAGRAGWGGGGQAAGGLALRAYRATVPALLAKGGGKGGGKGGKGGGRGDDEDAGPPVELPSIKDLDASMEKRVARLVSEFADMRGGRVTPDMFNNLMVEAHGTRISLGEAGQATLKTSSKINIAVYDPELVASVVKGIRESGQGLSPTSEGNNVVINVPKPSREARDGLVKQAGRVAERVKQEIRGIRKDGLDSLKRLKGKISEDETKSASKEIEGVTERKVDKVSKLLKEKEKELSGDGA